MRWLVVFVAALVVATPASGTGGGFFVSTCRASHLAPDDPIVFPKLPGLSHDHTFVGNVSTNAFSTLGSLRHGGTSCTPSADTAAYWAPTLYADGKPVKPIVAHVYYRRLTTAPVRPFPSGLRMVAGNSHATTAQSTQITYWDCSILKTTFYGRRANGAIISPTASSSVPTCPARAELQLHVNFPDCWDGKHLDSPDHRDHMAYAANGRCPTSHPIAVPAIELVYSYPARAVDGASVVILSSGGQSSGHADFINSWNEAALTKLVRTCLDEYAYCASEIDLG